jgi:hypothetical protein
MPSDFFDWGEMLKINAATATRMSKYTNPVLNHPEPIFSLH